MAAKELIYFLLGVQLDAGPARRFRPRTTRLSLLSLFGETTSGISPWFTAGGLDL